MSKMEIDRVQRNKKNRQIQLQRWNHFENTQTSNINHAHTKGKKKIEFDGSVMLLDAISRNDVYEVIHLLDQGVDPDCATADGLTALHQCCIDDFQEIAEVLVSRLANVNAVDSESWTPLHAAATFGNVRMCKLLCKNGADMLLMNTDGNMPYDICEGNDALKILEYQMSRRGITQQMIDDARKMPERKMLSDIKTLIDTNANLDEFDSQGATLIHIASCLGYNEVVQKLIESGAKYALMDKDGWLPIHLAARWGHVDIVEFFVAFGVDIQIPNMFGETVFDLCEPEIRKELIYISNNISSIRKNYNFNCLRPNKSLRRSRGSSVRRTSVRQKNRLSKKEAKEEYMVMTRNLSSTGDSLPGNNHEMLKNNSSTIEDDSDSSDTQSSKVPVHSLNQEHPISNSNQPSNTTSSSVQFQDNANTSSNSRYQNDGQTDGWFAKKSARDKKRRQRKCCFIL